MSALLIKLILSYLLGSLVGSLLLGRLRGVDIRTLGSGNAGSTNALRTQGKAFALATALIDVGKGMLAVMLISPLGIFGVDIVSPAVIALACGLAAAIGHCYPIFAGFRGGKGAGTLFGALLVLYPLSTLAALGLWIAALVGTGYVGLSTVLAGLSVAPLIWLVYPEVERPELILVALGGLFLLYTHRSNLQRLIAGTENRFERARIFARSPRSEPKS